MPRVGIFGGTFDPPHVGHLLAAVDATEALALDRVLWIPASTQPFKAARSDVASADDRLAMTRRTIGADPRFSVDTVELDRGGLSFMVDTVRALQQRDGRAEWYLLVGADAARTLPQWREFDRLLTMVQVVAMARTAAGEDFLLPRTVRQLDTRRVDLSSTEIRQRVAGGRSIRGFVTDAVADYITAAGLYRHGS
jgi:nicotinate-nucleotide adenylyltransferase